LSIQNLPIHKHKKCILFATVRVINLDVKMKKMMYEDDLVSECENYKVLIYQLGCDNRMAQFLIV
jgi:hypothetical protein